MPNQPTIVVEGLSEVLRDLRRFKDTEVPKAIRAANLEAAQMVASTAEAEAPKKSGRLAKSVKAKATQKSASVKAGSAVRVPYAGAIHFGWLKRHIHPNPFIYRALDRRIHDVHRRYVIQMDRVAERFNRGR